jgi:hypothetical protein
MNDKIEPQELTFEYVVQSIIKERHDAGDKAMTRILCSDKKNVEDWPSGDKFDILLKLVVNQIGEAQSETMNIRDLVKNMPDLEAEFQAWKAKQA